MRVTFMWGIRTYSGYGDNNVFSRWLDGRLCISRDYTYPKLTMGNARLGACGTNLYSLFLETSTSYKTDLTLYRDRRKLANKSGNMNKIKQVACPHLLFVAMLNEWAKTDPSRIDLSKVTLADIVTMNADVRTVGRAILAGYIPRVSPYTDLTAEIR